MNKQTHAARRLAVMAAPAILALIIGLLTTARPAGVSRAQGETLVRCNPAMAAGVVGQPLDVDIYVENVIDLWAGDVELSFDTTIAQIVDADPGLDGTQIKLLDDFLSPDFVLRKIADNVAGTILYAATQVQTDPPTKEPVSGSGPLARITFEAVKAGAFTMPFTSHLLGTPDGFEIPATEVDCQVTFITIDPDLSVYLPAAFDVP
jgi:hypothetical protein